MNNIVFGDALCFVLALNRDKKTVILVLNKFIPGYKKIGGDYAFNSTSDLIFESEEAILDYLQSEASIGGTIHWTNTDYDKVTIGAYFTTDEKLIINLTISGNGIKENQYMVELQTLLKSNVGVISYNQFPVFFDGEDFKNRYQ